MKAPLLAFSIVVLAFGCSTNVASDPRLQAVSSIASHELDVVRRSFASWKEARRSARFWEPPFADGTLDSPESPTGSPVSLVSKVLPMVEGVTNHGEVASFLLDTGSFASAIPTSHASQWELPVGQLPEGRIVASGGSMPARQFATLEPVAFGRIVAAGIDGILVRVQFDASCIIGIGLLSQHPLLFDAGRSEVRFLPGDAIGSALGTLYPERRWTALPLIWHGRQPSVVLAVADTKLRMFVDSGSSSTSLRLGVLEGLGLRPIRTSRTRTEDVLGARVEDLEIFRVEDLELGSWRCNLESDALPETTRDDDDFAAIYDGVLGFDFLGQIPWVFDGPAGVLWLLDPVDGANANLESTRTSNAIAWLEDPFPPCRVFAVSAIAELGAEEYASEVSELLDDEVAEVRAAAADALSELAGVGWPAASKVDAAKAWWDEHRSEQRFQATPADEN